MVILYNKFISAAYNYGLGIHTLTHDVKDWSGTKWRDENLGCTRDTPITVMFYMLGWSSMRSGYMLAHVKAYMDVIGDTHNPLHIPA